MNKLSTILTNEKGETRKITVYVDNKTLGILKNCSEQIRREYILEEYKVDLINRKETRRHQSLDKSLEHGFDIADSSADTYEQAERKERTDKLYKAIALLSPEQQKPLRQVYFEYIPQTEIAKREGVTKKAINNCLARILARLKKYLE